jgi:hypothetical protein
MRLRHEVSGAKFPFNRNQAENLATAVTRHVGIVKRVLRTQREEQMKRSFLLGVSGLAVAACAPQQPPPPTTAAPPPSYATGSPSATTTFYDGTYIGSFTQNMSASGSGCPNFPVAPALTIRNGVAQFAALDLTYQGYVTPQGDVNMQTPAGQTFMGHIDPNYKLTGRTTGRCVYDATWQRRVGQKPS